MNEEIIFELKTFQKGVQLNVTLTAIDDDNQNPFGSLRYLAIYGIKSKELTFAFEDDSIILPGQLSISFSDSCLILCGIALAGPILDCYRKNKKDWIKFKECLKDQGATLTSSAIACLAACIK